MPTTFMSGKNTILGLSEPEKKTNFNSVEHEKSFITSGPAFLYIGKDKLNIG